MASIQPLRGEALPARAADDSASPAEHPIRPWLAGRSPEERIVDLLGFSMASEQGLATSPETMAQMREKAATALAEYAIRHLHNRVAEIRQEAIMEQFGRAPRPLGFVKLLAANLLALGLAAGAAGWLYLHQDSWLSQSLAALVGLTPG